MAPVLAALNGVAYDTCGSEPEATAVCEIPVFAVFDSARGVSFAGSRPDTSVTFSVVNGQVQITQGSTVAAGASVAVQGWFTLVAGGTAVAPSGGNLVNTDWRAAIAVLDTATMAIVIARMDMVGFANAIATYLPPSPASLTATLLPDLRFRRSPRVASPQLEPKTSRMLIKYIADA